MSLLQAVAQGDDIDEKNAAYSWPKAGGRSEGSRLSVMMIALLILEMGAGADVAQKYFDINVALQTTRRRSSEAICSIGVQGILSVITAKRGAGKERLTDMVVIVVVVECTVDSSKVRLRP